MEKEILEGNKIIEKFMGNPNIVKSALDMLQYDSSWDWLMPVCKKLDRLSEDGIIEHTRNYEFWCDKLDDTVTRNYDIMPVFKIVVEFIEWYNSQNN